MPQSIETECKISFWNLILMLIGIKKPYIGGVVTYNNLPDNKGVLITGLHLYIKE